MSKDAMSNGLKLRYHFLKILKLDHIWGEPTFVPFNGNGALLTALSNLVTLEGEDIFQLQWR
jgi:hypothetical protein